MNLSRGFDSDQDQHFVISDLGPNCLQRFPTDDKRSCQQEKFLCLINPFMPNGISHGYQLDESISNFSIVGLFFFIFIPILKRNFCKQTVGNLIRRRVLWCLIWFCIVCRCPTKRTYALIKNEITTFAFNFLPTSSFCFLESDLIQIWRDKLSCLIWIQFL